LPGLFSTGISELKTGGAKKTQGIRLGHMDLGSLITRSYPCHHRIGYIFRRSDGCLRRRMNLRKLDANGEEKKERGVGILPLLTPKP